MIQPITNLNPLSAADPILLQKSGKSGVLAEDSGLFKSDLDDHLAQAGGIEGAQANLAAMMAAQAQSQPVQVAGPRASQEGQLPNPMPQADVQKATQNVALQRPSRDPMARMELADYTPMTARVSSSVNAASTIAGLKPWNQEWVFEGNPNPTRLNEDVRPLFGPSNHEVELAQVQEALAQLGLGSGAAQVPQNLREGLQMRGDQDTTTMTANAKMAEVQANPAERTQMAQVAGVLAGNLSQQLHPQLHPQLQAMNGQMTEVSADGTAKMPGAIRGGDARKAAPANGQLALAGSSGMSGADFMSALQKVRPNPALGAEKGGDSMQQDFSGMARPELKVIDGAKPTKGASDDFLMSSAPASMSGLHSPQSASAQPAQPPVQVTGHVVPGAMSQDQLSHEALLGVSTGIRNMTPQGGGEMRIRLRPENLGELHLKVVAQGNEVGIQIQASDEKAKKILQDSLGSLKESLAQQNLTLSKVEFSVAQATGGHGASSDSSHQQQQSSAHQQFNHSAFGQNAGDNRNNGQAQWSDPESEAVGARPLKSAASASTAGASSRTSQNRAANGRLDVQA